MNPKDIEKLQVERDTAYRVREQWVVKAERAKAEAASLRRERDAAIRVVGQLVEALPSHLSAEKLQALTALVAEATSMAVSL